MWCPHYYIFSWDNLVIVIAAVIISIKVHFDFFLSLHVCLALLAAWLIRICEIGASRFPLFVWSLGMWRPADTSSVVWRILRKTTVIAFNIATTPGYGCSHPRFAACCHSFWHKLTQCISLIAVRRVVTLRFLNHATVTEYSARSKKFMKHLIFILYSY